MTLRAVWAQAARLDSVTITDDLVIGEWPRYMRLQKHVSLRGMVMDTGAVLSGERGMDD